MSAVHARYQGIILLIGAFMSPSLRASDRFCVGRLVDAARTHDSLTAALLDLPANPEVMRIDVVQGVADFNQSIEIKAGTSIAIRGGYLNCSQQVPSIAHTVLSGRGGNRASVIAISGPGTVVLERLVILGGDTEAEGGGIRYRGSDTVEQQSRLILAATTVTDNHSAGNGGGVYFEAGAAPARLELRENVRFLTNSAEAGGAIMLRGPAQLIAEAGGLQFHHNEARGSGGALHIESPAAADIGAPAVQGPPVFLNNQAGISGGAISVSPRQGPATPSAALVRLYSTDARSPLTIEGNSALRGGAFSISGTTNAICARNVNILDNTARSGAVLHAWYSTRFGECEGIDFPAAAIQRCSLAAECGRIEGNSASDFGLVDPVLFRLVGADVSLRGARITENEVGAALFHIESASGLPANVEIRDSLVAQNHIEGETPRLFSVSPPARVLLDQVTVAGNRLSGPLQPGTVFGVHAAGGTGDRILSVHNSIVYQPATALIETPGAYAEQLQYLVLHELPSRHDNNLTLLVSEPRFVADADYRLTATSPAVDFAALVGSPRDIDGGVRPVDIPGAVNRFGAVDLGAFELQDDLDRIHADGFEP